MKKISLNDNWSLRREATQEVYQTKVPAMAATVLLEAGVIKDPYVGENEWETLEVLKEDYTFFRSFHINQEALQSDEILLEFQGLDTAAQIYLNDDYLGFVNDMHRTYTYVVNKQLVTGENTLVLKFQSGVTYALEQHEKEPYYSTSDTVDGFCLVRKAHSAYGWDWGPKLPDIGIYREVNLLCYESAKLKDIYIRQTHREQEVEVFFETEITTYRKEGIMVEVQLTNPDGKTWTTQTAVADIRQTQSIVVKQPQLWWCHGFGEQPLYEVCVRVKAGEEVIDEVHKRIGLRTLTIRQEPDEWGESFEFCINGISFFAMGANYIPEDCLYARGSRERSEDLVRQCIAANYNSIRVWGGGYFCEDYFYDLCDEYGLVVWQDLLFACGVYRLHEEFVENVVEETKDNLRRLRHHASIGLWCGNNELEWGWSDWDMGFGNSNSDKADYIKLFEWILPQTAKETDPDRFYWLASPSSGGSFDNPNDQNRGDVHYWEVWHRLKHFTEYRKYYFRFCSEFGFQSFPSVKTIDTFAAKEEQNIFSPVMENHQKNGGANGLILYYLSANFAYPTTFEKLVYVSQILQAEAIKYGVEHWRSNRGRCMGALYWQVNDCWPVASWSSLDYYLRWKPLHYYAKKFYAPVLLCAREEAGLVRLVVSNETRQTQKVSVSARLRTNKGAILEETEVIEEVGILSVKECLKVDYQKQVSDRYWKREHYLEYVLKIDGREVCNNALLFARPKQFTFENPRLRQQVREESEVFVLEIETETFAKYVFLEHPEFDFVAEDNCFDVSKGTKKVITVKKDSIKRDGQIVTVTAEDFERMGILSAYDIR